MQRSSLERISLINIRPEFENEVDQSLVMDFMLLRGVGQRASEAQRSHFCVSYGCIYRHGGEVLLDYVEPVPLDAGVLGYDSFAEGIDRCGPSFVLVHGL